MQRFAIQWVKCTRKSSLFIAVVCCFLKETKVQCNVVQVAKCSAVQWILHSAMQYSAVHGAVQYNAVPNAMQCSIVQCKVKSAGLWVTGLSGIVQYSAVDFAAV